MTGYQIGGEWLDFAGTIALEMRSPLFDADSIPGVLSYPSAFKDTPRNRRLLGFPAVRARRVGPVPAVPADLYIGGLLWRRGVLQYQDFDSKQGEYSYQFQADADALATLIQDVLLSELPLGRLPVQVVAETDDYVLAPIRNNAFYDEDKNPDWGKVVNYYAPLGGFLGNATPAHVHTTVPLLKVVPLLKRCLAVYGYEVEGPWLTDAEIQQLVLYSRTSLDQATGSGRATDFAIADLLPDVRLADWLLTLQQTFALAFVFDPLHKRVRVVPLRELVARPAATRRTVSDAYRDVANEGNGFTLAFTADSDDELLKSMPWPELAIGGGKQQIQPAADPLRMVREADPTRAGREWLVPAAEQAGRSARLDFEQTDVRSSQLRFLFYRGLQLDNSGLYYYPLVSAGTENYAGTQVGNYALAWDGAKGLYQQWHKPWLDFLANARIEERSVALTLGEFVALDPTQPDLVQGLAFLWENVSITVGGAETLDEATITYHQLTP